MVRGQGTRESRLPDSTLSFQASPMSFKEYIIFLQDV